MTFQAADERSTALPDQSSARLRRGLIAGLLLATTAAGVVAVLRSRPPDRANSESSQTGPLLGLLPVPQPRSNPSTPEKVALGRRLFFDRVLSRDQTVSCASCHDPAHGYSIPDRTAQGVGGAVGRRHPSTLVNVAYNTFQFWDGRIGTLEEHDSLERQALRPIRDPHEMDLDPEEAARRLNADPGYSTQFQLAFGEPASAETIARAIAAFERTLLFGDAPYDRFEAGNRQALSPAAIRGRDLFFWKATCSACHRGPNLTDNSFHPGIASAATEADQPESAAAGDPGRFEVTTADADRGFFKTPTLREVARHPPYMHDGSVATLEDVVARYNQGGFDTHYWSPAKRQFLEELLQKDDESRERHLKSAAPQLRAGFPLFLSEEEQRDLVTFLREGLTSTASP